MNEQLLLPKLRHERWMGWTEIPGRELVKLPGLPGLPKVGLGEDTPQRYSYVQHHDLVARTFEQLEALAVANLAKRPGQWKIKTKSGGVLGIGAKPSMIELVDEFACERILDVAFMQKAHALLKSPLIAVAVPVRGILWAAPAGGDVATVGNLIALARRAFVEAPANMEPISPAVLTVSDGKVVGVVQGMTGETPELDREHVEPTRGFPWPVQPIGGESADDEDEEIDDDDDSRRLHMVGYVKQTKSVEFACYLGEGESIPAAEIAELAAWVERKTTPAGDPIAEVRVSFPDATIAKRAAPQIRPTGARIVYMDDHGADVYLP
jgi:hypothetical protein